MKVLLDTNIIIHRENVKVTNAGIGLLFYWLDKLHCEKCVHPYSLKELRSFRDKNMQKLYDAKLSAYVELKTISEQTPTFISLLPKVKSENDEIDNQLLCEVFNNRVDLLITEDKGLREKARAFNLRNKVVSINEFISKATAENPELISYKMLAVKKELIGDIDVKNGFFNTFRDAYYQFEDWFNRKSEETAYVCRTDLGEILGFLYLKTETKEENYADISPVFNPKKRLKIGTFKVESSGFRLGERFIKIIFDNAIERRVDEIYITLFEDRPELKSLEDLLLAWGFEKYGAKNTYGKEEVVLVKEIGSYNSKLSTKQNYPNILSNRSKYILPIYAKYHTTLLPDSKLNTENEIDFMGKVPHRYALQKVYISWSIERDVRPGDLILFYRMGETPSRKKFESVLSTIGLVDHYDNNFKRKEDFLKICQNRSVFSIDELNSFWEKHQRNLSVLRFIYVKSLKKRLTLEYLWNRKIVVTPNGPRPFTPISDEQFQAILNDSETEVKFVSE